MSAILSLLAAAAVQAAPAPAPPALPYGPPIPIEQARIVVAAAEAEAARRGASPTIAVVDPAGRLVYFEKSDKGNFSAYEMALRKARAAARTKRPTKFDADRVAAGQQFVMMLPDVFPAPGGQVIVKDGLIIGAIGETGGADDDVAMAGAKALQ